MPVTNPPEVLSHVERLRKTKKQDIDMVFGRVKSEIERNGYLDHEIRAIEDLMHKELKDDENKKARNAKPRRKPNPVYYKIYKTPKEYLKTGQGVVYAFDRGLDMLYSPSGNRLHILIAISHELGHSMLEHLDTRRTSTQSISDPVLETQASYFAKKSVEYRSSQYQDEAYLSSHYFNEDTIQEAISRIHSGYNEELLK